MLDTILRIFFADLVFNFSLLEIMWTLTALFAFHMAMLNRREAIEDMVALGGIRNGMWTLARGHVRRENMRVVMNFEFILFGLLAGVTPANPNPTLVGFLVSLGLTHISAWMAYHSVLDRRERKYIVKLPETPLQREDRIAGDDRRAGYQSAQERTAKASERLADAVEEDATGKSMVIATERVADAHEREENA